MADRDLSPAEIKAEQARREAEAFYQNRPFETPLEWDTNSEPSIYSSSTISESTIEIPVKEVEPISDIIQQFQPFIWPALLALAGFVVRLIVTKKKTKPLEFLLDCFAAMIIGSLVGVAIEDMEFSQNIRYAIISVAGMVGPDLAGGIIILGQAFKESPTDFIIKHYNAIRGLKDDGEKKGEKGEKKEMTYEEWNQKNKEFIDQTFG
jgi:hypothetical protein